MNKIYTLLLSTIFGLAAFAQTSKTDRLYENWEYFDAAARYEKEAAKKPSADTYFKLGECYRKMNSYKKQEQAAYDKVNAYGTYKDAEFYYNYGQVLRSNGKNEQAKIAFDKLTELKPNDPRGKFFSDAITIAAEDSKTDQEVKITPVTALNSKQADFNMVKFQKGFAFTSSRKTSGHGKIYPWEGDNYLDVYVAEKGTDALKFNNVAPFDAKKVNNKFHDGPACFSKNFDTMYIARVEKYLKGDEKKTLQIEQVKIFSSTFENGKWTKAVPFHVNSDLYSVSNPFLSADGSKLYFASNMPGGFGESDIYYCTKNGKTWSSPINMGPNINTFNREKFPSIDSAGNFYFSSDGYQGIGGTDICVALLKNGVYQKAIPMKYPINSPYDDQSILFMDNEKTAYISSNRNSGTQSDNSGSDDILYFDLLDQDFPASIYTIGYQPKKEVEEIAVVEVPAEEPAAEKPVKALSAQPMEMNIYFDFDKSDIRSEAAKSIDSISNYMKDYPETKLILGGYCDIRGSSEYNINLSDARNNSVIDYLVAKGINRNRISATAYGFTHLVNGCSKGVTCSHVEHQLNRRVEGRFENQKGGKVANKSNKGNKTGEHVVKKGETLYSISKEHEISVEELKRLNKMDNETIKVGQALIVRI